MNQELFDSMQKQMNPSPQVRAALTEKLARPVKKRPVPWMKYGALAACAALVIGAFPLYQAMKDLDSSNGQEILWTHRAGVPLHSYVTVGGVTGYVQENATTATGGEDSEGGDRDMGMTPEDLEQAMLDVGYTQEEIDEYQSISYQMTWAKWWKFVGEQRNSEGDDPFNLDNLKTFSQEELFVNTGALPAPNPGDLPNDTYLEWEQKSLAQQEAVNAYQKLMGHFALGYPNWYGGAYIDDNNNLMVLLVEDKDPGDKSLEQKVLNWTGSDKVIFGSAKYSLRYLRDLQDKVVDAMLEQNLFSDCGTYESENRLHLTLTDVTDEALAILAELDPEDDAILVQVGQRVTLDVAPGEVTGTDSAATEAPAVHHVMPGGATVPDDEDLIADEPVYEGAHYDVKELPEKLPKEEKRPAITVDSVPEEDASTSSYNPDAK